MLGLELRKEFCGKRLKGTQIELPTAVAMTASEFLRITYPTGDVLAAVEAIGPDQRLYASWQSRNRQKTEQLSLFVEAGADALFCSSWNATS
jgi:hypothetical protein